MHSSYQHHETLHADMTLSIHERISDLHRRAEGLAPRVSDSALDSGCTDTRPAGPRQAKAWDMVAEAHGWNAISDDPAMVAQADQYERDSVSYRVEWVGGDDLNASPWTLLAEGPRMIKLEIFEADGTPVITTEWRESEARQMSAYRMRWLRQARGHADRWAKTTDGQGNVKLYGSVTSEPHAERVDEMIGALDARPDLGDGIDPRTWREVYDAGLVDVADITRAYGFMAAEPPAGPEPQTVHIQATTGTVHETPDCSVARRTRYGTIPADVTPEVRAALADGVYRWCQKCHTPEPPAAVDEAAEVAPVPLAESAACPVHGWRNCLCSGVPDYRVAPTLVSTEPLDRITAEDSAPERAAEPEAITVQGGYVVSAAGRMDRLTGAWYPADETAELDTFTDAIELASRFPGMEREDAQELMDEANEASEQQDPGNLGLFIRQEHDLVSRSLTGETLYRLTRRNDGRYQVTEVLSEQRS